jgi:ferric-dicitrate binding protein FerR (iron transport regulator)
MSDALRRALAEARRDWGTDEVRRVDWAVVDQRIFARIDEDHGQERAALAPKRRALPWRLAGLAMAAAVAVVFFRTRGTQSIDADRAVVMDDAGSIVGIDGEGEVLLDERQASIGATVRLGDVIEARGADVTLGRAGKLTLVLERGSIATVTHVQGALVLSLGRGALEAQVVPVASGEALAVDVGPSRVAVHGTHLRVARLADHVVVDLNEGVVSVGAAPRIGSTLGALVTAPAHAEFSAADAQATIRVTHDLSEVRGPIALSAPAQVKRGTGAPVPPPVAARAEARESTPVSASPRVEAHSAPTGSGPQSVGAADPNAAAAVDAAVRACIAERPHSDEVSVIVSTTLHLQIDDDGSVHSARFEPPVAPEVNACAAHSIYKTHFPHGGAVTIPISVKN